MPGPDTIKSVGVNGFDMTYVERGEGEPVVFVHGTISDYRSWDEHLPVIGQSYRAIAPTLRYWGTAPWPDDGENYSIQTHAGDLAAMIRALAIEPVTLVGWSHGGSVSLVTAAQNPGLVRRMFLYEASLATFLSDPTEAKAAAESRVGMFGDAMELVEKGEFEAAMRTVLESLNKTPGFFDTMTPAFQTMFRENTRTMPLMMTQPPAPDITADDLRAFDMPAAFLFGGESHIFFKIAARAAAALLPAAEHHVIDGAVHLWPGMDPDAFNRRLLDFLART